ncbi:MAG: 3-hydroxyacyl-CoA dehydrogenase NAD-binding domain-containing protein [Deinococcaceae bacterium]
MSIKNIAILGAGTMGQGIAQVCLDFGFSVHVYDVHEEGLERARQAIEKDLKRQIQRGKRSESEADEMLKRLSLLTQWAPDADLVIEAVPENLELKRQLLRQAEDGGRPDTLLATNTSTLSVSAIGGGLKRPENLVGLHFFNPAPRMPLVEVIAGDLTSVETLETATAWVKAIGKKALLVRDTPGFVVNRVARPFYGEGLRLLEEGANPSDVDRLLRASGFKMGPFELMDLIGLDVNLANTKSIYRSSFEDPKYRPSSIQQRLVDSGRLGRKTGRGFYTYPEDS